MARTLPTLSFRGALLAPRNLHLTSRRDRGFCVYIMASRSKNLYTGVTNNLFRRMIEHRRGLVPGFTSRYRICRLVYVEQFRYIRDAIAREKQIKAWTRAKRIALIEEKNPGWYDFAKEWWGNDERNADSSHDAGRIGSE